jgi:cell division protease FtsH
VRGTLRGAPEGRPRTFTAVRVEDPKLLEELERHGVVYTGEISSRWMGEVLGWMIPLMLIIASGCSSSGG